MKPSSYFRLLFAAIFFIGTAFGQTLVIKPGHQEWQSGPPGVWIYNPDGTEERIGTGLISGIHAGGSSIGALANPANGVLQVDGLDHTATGGANSTNLCTALAYVNNNPTVFVYKVVDALAYDSEAKDPWNDATCGNTLSNVSGALTYEFGKMNFIIGWGGTLHIPAGAIFKLSGRGSENQLSTATGCGTATPTACAGTLFAVYQTASPFTSTFAMTCPGCTLFPTSTPVIDYAGSGVSSFGTQLVGPGTITAAGIAGSIGVQNTGAQENSGIANITIAGAQAIGLDINQSTAQNFTVGPGVEIISGLKTGATIGTPSTFVCAKWSVNGPNRDMGNITCNPRGAATTTSIAAAVEIVGPGGSRQPSGHVHEVHAENVKIGVLCDGCSNVKIDNITTSSTTQDASTPTALVYICGAASPAPCTTGLTSLRVNVEALAIISPSAMPNYVVDDTNTRTFTTSTWPGRYDTAGTGFNTIASGTNSSAAMVVGSGSSLISTGTGQLIGDSDWFNIANGSIFPPVPTAAVTNTGGSWGQGTIYVRITYVGLATTIPSAELGVTSDASNCPSNSTCTVTVTMPTSCTAGNLPAGVTGCTVWDIASTVNGEKQQAAGNNCVNITSATCVIGTPAVGANLSASISTSSGILPSPLTSITQPDFIIPTSYLQIGDGSYEPCGGIDVTGLNFITGQARTGAVLPVTGGIPGTYTWTCRFFINDTGTPPIASNGLFSLHHQTGQTTGMSNTANVGIGAVDSAMRIEQVNAGTSNPFVQQSDAQYNENLIQNNLFTCQPTSGGFPWGEDCASAGRFNVTDSRSSNNSTQNFYTGVHGIAYAGPASGSAVIGTVYAGVQGGAGPTVSALSTTNTQFWGGIFGVTGLGAMTGSGIGGAVKLFGPTTKWPSGGANLGLFLDSNFNAGGTTNFVIRSDGTDPSVFAGKLAPVLGLQNNAPTLPVIGDISAQGSITTTSLTNPTIGACAATGTTGATTISYKIVALDNNGYPTAVSGICTVANANATLGAGNNVVINVSTAVATNPGASSWAVYRTATNGTSPTTTGKIGTLAQVASFFTNGQNVLQFTDTGLAPSVASATPPTVNAGTSIVASGIVQGANTQRVTGSNFTTSSASLVALFTWHLTGGVSYSFHCAGAYQQATAAAGLTLGVQAGANTAAAPVNVSASATIYTNTTGAASTFTTGTLATLNTTTATNILAGGAPAATGTNYRFEIDGGVTMNATDPGDFVIMAATANASDQITILKDASYCQLF